jgi:hypothetical protein
LSSAVSAKPIAAPFFPPEKVPVSIFYEAKQGRRLQQNSVVVNIYWGLGVSHLDFGDRKGQEPTSKATLRGLRDLG